LPAKDAMTALSAWLTVTSTGNRRGLAALLGATT